MKHMKQVSKTDTSYQGSECGFFYIQIVSLDTKIYNRATRFTCINGEYIANKLDKPKSKWFPLCFDNGKCQLKHCGRSMY